MATTLILLALICTFSCTAASKARLGFVKRGAAESGRSSSSSTGLQTYIVHVTKPETFASTEEDLESFHRSFLPTSTESSGQEERLVYSYQHVASGFAARLTQEEAEELLLKDGVVSTRAARMLSLHTTHTPDFLGLQQNVGLWKNSSFGKGVIIGLMDTGILPTHPSFNDDDMPSPPAKWKGKCEFASCNKKLIGARNFNSFTKGQPPVDDVGHGTHTASTAGGAFVQGANLFGNAEGTAAGMAPHAHLAMYKVCSETCSESDILAGMDAAIEDGVDILSLSLGGPSYPFFDDSIAVGAFAAIQKGIVVSCAAGNSGPISSSVSNEAPWILTVGASTVDRAIRSTVKLGNGAEYDGESLFQPKDFPATQLPLVFPGQGSSNPDVAVCAGSLNSSEVSGKIVLCQSGGPIGLVAKGQVVKEAGGAAMILMNEETFGYTTFALAQVLPASGIAFADGDSVLAYINSTAAPTAALEFKGTVLGVKTAPAVSFFSSRGPAEQTPGILKPDIIGPGVNILAAWPFQLDNSSTSAAFNIISGTSMACPHLSGIAALLKSSHPDWTPAAIRSAIMTSADTLNLGKKPIPDQTLTPADLFATGAGHVNPSKANDPGLIYDVQPDDYLPLLCGLGYTDSQIATIAQKTVNCSTLTPIPQAELNYPSFSIKLGSTPQTYSRTFTNVGKPASFYNIQVVSPLGVDVSTDIQEVKFSALGQTATYKVTFTRAGGGSSQTHAQGSLSWVSDDGYSVRSPIMVTFI
uniref:Uncharacterized protein n=1 Tax=Kalanchoe fedtschenkoi TaxID=63787 RepID=A0A7N0U150_KALFE